MIIIWDMINRLYFFKLKLVIQKKTRIIIQFEKKKNKY